MTESKAIAKTKFTVVTIWYNSSSGSEYGTNYFWINQETNAKLIEAVLEWAGEYLHGDQIEWEHSYQTDVETTVEEIRQTVGDGYNYIISKQVKDIPNVPEDLDADDVGDWVITTLDEFSE